jgi:phage regulator Rha-like protein
VPNLVPIELIEKKICFIRGEKVMLDMSLAHLYDVETKALNRAVKRNIDRFPEDFMFQLTQQEFEFLRCHIGTSSLNKNGSPLQKEHGGRRYLPYAFTEHGVAMLSSVLRSKRAVQVNIEIVRTFIHLRKILATDKDLAEKITKLEKKCDVRFKSVFDAIFKLMEDPKPKPGRKIGFKVKQ